MNTKEKILTTATQAFNDKGYSAVNLKDLSRIMGISRGNLAYHFKDKDLLLESIVSEMWDKIDLEKAKARQVTSFENLRSQTRLYYKFQKEYSFIFLDTHVTNHPIVKKQFRMMIQKSIDDFNAMIAFGIHVGNLKEEPVPGAYNSLAFTIWMLGFYWLPQQVTRGEKTAEDAEKMVWGLVLPYMTKKGMAAFKRFFGDDFYENLGEPFKVELKDYMMF